MIIILKIIGLLWLWVVLGSCVIFYLNRLTDFTFPEWMEEVGAKVLIFTVCASIPILLIVLTLTVAGVLK